MKVCNSRHTGRISRSVQVYDIARRPMPRGSSRRRVCSSDSHLQTNRQIGGLCNQQQNVVFTKIVRIFNLLLPV